MVVVSKKDVHRFVPSYAQLSGEKKREVRSCGPEPITMPKRNRPGRNTLSKRLFDYIPSGTKINTLWFFVVMRFIKGRNRQKTKVSLAEDGSGARPGAWERSLIAEYKLSYLILPCSRATESGHLLQIFIV